MLQVNLSGDYGLVRLKEIAEELQKDWRHCLRCSEPDLRGGLEREVKVEVDLSRMNYYGVALQRRDRRDPKRECEYSRRRSDRRRFD